MLVRTSLQTSIGRTCEVSVHVSNIQRATRLLLHTSGSSLHVRATPEAAETAGVRALLERDRKALVLPENDPFADEGPSSVAAPDTDALPPPAAGKQATQARLQTLSEEAHAPQKQQNKDGPRTAAAAIALGVQQLGAGNAQDAINSFQSALELPGKGAFRLAGSPKEFSCCSEGEEMAALYNLACAYVALGQKDAALASLEGAIEAGFDDFEVLRNDPDLTVLQGPALEGLLSRDKGLFAWLNPFRGRK